MTLSIERDGPVTTLIRDRREARNAMDPASAEDLVEKLLTFDAVAGGMELALWCDLRVMEERAFMGVYCRRWGVPLIDGGTVRLPRIVGRGRALDIILTGRKVPAKECFAIGLCERIVPDGESRAAAETLAQEIARFPQACVRADRASVWLQEGLSEDALRAEWRNSIGVFKQEGASGAARFASGKGRGGDFKNI